MNDEFKTTTDGGNHVLDYVALASELALTKRQLIKLRSIDKILTPNNGENYVLGYLAEYTGPVTPKEISIAMHISSARIAMILKQLEMKGFIERKPNPCNGRQTLVQILYDGLSQHKKNKDDFINRTIQFLKALGPEDAATYVRLQKKIVKIFS